ncbi:hypothetical protein J6590_011021 [Homalodisca vitripennis]|nr:hypothetical protein J6590_011021 [Homalodisca vitripennis]
MSSTHIGWHKDISKCFQLGYQIGCLQREGANNLRDSLTSGPVPQHGQGQSALPPLLLPWLGHVSQSVLQGANDTAGVCA